jgi:hypothetical protein
MVCFEKDLKRKRKKKETSPPYLSAQQPTGPLNFSRSGPPFLFLFLFLLSR